MIEDSRNLFVGSLALSGLAVGSTLIGNVIDTGSVHRDIGQGQPLYFFIEVITSIIAAGAGTIDFQLQSDSVATINSGSQNVITGSGSTVTATTASGLLVAGQQLTMKTLPMEGLTWKQFLGLVAVVGGNAITGGSITAGFVIDPHGAGTQSYPRNYL